MGYYTEYEIEAVGSDFGEGLTPEGIVTRHIGYSPFEDRCKWYDHDSVMKSISKQYPDALFKLTGNGEESPDLWVKYYQNGKVHAIRATITYAPFDPSKLSDDGTLRR